VSAAKVALLFLLAIFRVFLNFINFLPYFFHHFMMTFGVQVLCLKNALIQPLSSFMPFTLAIPLADSLSLTAAS
jgi:hypothetical protein